jgi:hypothetical protein
MRATCDDGLSLSAACVSAITWSCFHANCCLSTLWRKFKSFDPTYCKTDGAGATGLIYLFSVYSSALKKRFDLTQRSLQTIETCMFLAGTVSGEA